MPLLIEIFPVLFALYFVMPRHSYFAPFNTSMALPRGSLLFLFATTNVRWILALSSLR